jgi:hypothetical protein
MTFQQSFITLAAVVLAAMPMAGADTTGAVIEKPVSAHVNGAYCRNDGKGTVGGVFPSSEDVRLAFSIGPGTYSAVPNSKQSKQPYTGSGTYKNVMMSINAGNRAKPNWIAGLGTIVVNRDGRTGSFKTDDGAASGTWDCGKQLQ